VIESLQQKKHFNQLDGLRCIAVLFVLIEHWMYYRDIGLLPLGHMGVNLFFVLSGFLITRILLISKDESDGYSIFPRIKRFYIRRALRIFPIYYLTLIFLIAIKFFPTSNVVWLATYTYNIKASFENMKIEYFINHFWSLSVEEQFYIFFPFMVFFIPKSKIKSFFFVIIIIGVLSRGLLYIFSAPPGSIYLLTPCCFDAFGIGSLLAYYLLYELDTLKNILKKNYFFFVVVFFFIMDIFLKIYKNEYVEGIDTVLERFLFSVCCFFVIGRASLDLYKGLIKKFLENKAIVYIGKISYGIYLYHYLLFSLFADYLDPFLISHFHINKNYFFDPAFEHNNTILTALFLFAVTLCVASLSWYLIELPISKFKEKLKQ
jgi:peptidoglycan/LPS O-acetylase OafA/YrhL